ncbi:putative peptidase (DUF1758) [Popillia japonica]|uniref:Peptidase (DUF1758) n=1 Tax=Popillia japonica TaxID=7064 RepID=A0AAW1M1A6_POPJA
MNVSGISNGKTSIKHKVQITIKSIHNNFKTQISCLVLPSITDNIPSKSFSTQLIKIPSSITLADPSFYQSRSIDLLLGASIFWQLICVGQIREKNCPVLQKTRLGWVVSGELNVGNVPHHNTQALLTLNHFTIIHKRY